MLKRVVLVTVFSAGLFLLSAFGIAIAGRKISTLVGLVLSVVVVLWTAAWKPAALIRRAVLAATAVVVLAAIPVDIRFVASGRLGVHAGPAMWGPITPDIAALAPPHAVFMGCIMPTHPVRYVLAVSF